MPTAQILILGGGVAGSVIANRLARRLNPGEANVAVIDQTGRHSYQPGFLEVACGRIRPDELVRPERTLLDKRVGLRVGEVCRIDTEERRVILADGAEIRFDYLVIATGAELARDQVPGLAAGGHHYHSAGAALDLCRALERFRGGHLVMGVTSLPYKCPPGPPDLRPDDGRVAAGTPPAGPDAPAFRDAARALLPGKIGGGQGGAPAG